MRFPNRETVERIREAYPAGTRVELVQMDDMQAPPEGTRGTVKGVDDTGSIMVAWDNGSRLNVVYGEDVVKKIEEYNKTDTQKKPQEKEESVLGQTVVEYINKHYGATLAPFEIDTVRYVAGKTGMDCWLDFAEDGTPIDRETNETMDVEHMLEDFMDGIVSLEDGNGADLNLSFDDKCILYNMGKSYGITMYFDVPDNVKEYVDRLREKAQLDKKDENKPELKASGGQEKKAAADKEKTKDSPDL